MIGGGRPWRRFCLPNAAAHSCGSPERDESQLDNVALGALDNTRWLRKLRRVLEEHFFLSLITLKDQHISGKGRSYYSSAALANREVVTLYSVVTCSWSFVSSSPHCTGECTNLSLAAETEHDATRACIDAPLHRWFLPLYAAFLFSYKFAIHCAT